MRLQVSGSERHVQNDYTFFVHKTLKMVFAIYVVRLALYVCLKNICDGVGSQDKSNGTTLDPPIFWLDNIFNLFILWPLASLLYPATTGPVLLHTAGCPYSEILQVL